MSAKQSTEAPRALRTAFIVHFWADYLAAVPLMVAPVWILKQLNVVVDPLGVRLFAAALFAIGGESLLGRDQSRAQFSTMLRMKCIWSSAAIVAILLAVVSPRLEGGAFPNAATLAVYGLALLIFVPFSALWWYWFLRLRREAADEAPVEVETDVIAPEN